MALVTQNGQTITTQAGAAINAQASTNPHGFDIAVLRVRAGLDAGDGSRDAEIIVAMGMALSLAERYCDRKFARMNDTERFTHHSGQSVSLHRYPVTAIAKVTCDGTDVTSHHVDHLNGYLHFDGRVQVHEMQVEYDGGYDVYPADLEFALLQLFDSVWNVNYAGGSVSSGGIKTVRAGSLSITYDTGGAAQVAGGGNALGGIMPASTASILDLYSRHKV